MVYRVCKAFTVESGHLLSKHPGACRFPHGHTRRVEVVLSSATLDERDMVCDFKAVKLAVQAFIDRFDHAMAINSSDPRADAIRALSSERIVEFDNQDPTTEAMARLVFDHLAGVVSRREVMTDPKDGVRYAFPPGVRVERVRVSETPTSWAEYGAP